RTIVETTFLPGLGVGGDSTRAEELTSGTATDTQSIQAVLHNLRFGNQWARSPRIEPATRLAHWTIVGLLTVLTLAVIGRRSPTPGNELALTGALLVVMTVASPVSHLHYYVFPLPLITALWGRPHRRGIGAVLAFFLIATAATLLPVVALRHFGLIPASALLLWAAALVPPRPEAAAA